VPSPHPVLLLVRELDQGGCERDLTKIALGLDRSRFEPHVGCLRPEGFRNRELSDAGVPIVHFPVRSFASAGALRAGLQLRRYLKGYGIRLIHSYDVPMDVFGLAWGYFWRTPVLISSQLSYRELYSPFYQRLLRITDRLADCVVVNCEAMRRHLIDDEGVAAGKLFLSYNGVDTSVFFPGQPAKSEPLVIGTVAALRPEKRLDLLVDAFARVRDLSLGMRLAIVGSGSVLPALRQQATRLGIAADCVFQPATADVASWLRGMDIFVLPSESEAFSNALLEAMACGCCPVGSRVGGTPELIADGERGLLFESGNAADLAEKLARLIRDAGLRRKFGEAAAACARDTFSIQRAVQRMEELYGRLLTRSSLESPRSPSNG